MIVVTGATGQLGRMIVQRLVARGPAGEVGASVRDPDKARDLAALGVRVRHGDFAEPDGLPHAFEGASQVLLVSSNARATGGDAIAQHRAAIDAARAAGARRVVYTSQMASSATSKFPPMLDHAATEDMLRGSGMAWTALRNGFYGASALQMMGDGLDRGVLEAPQDGPVAWTAHADLAAGAAAVLSDEGRFDGPTPPLTGAEALDLADLAREATEALGRPVERRVLTDEEMRARLAARGLPPHVAAIAMGLYLAARDGEFDKADPTLGRLIGRRPTTMREMIAERAAG